MSLDQAIQDLKAARPDPAKVEALTAETLKRRETPYEIRDVYRGHSAGGRDGYYTTKELECQLCGSVLHVKTDQHYHLLLPDPHLDWHNNLERRLQQLEQQ